MSYKKFSIQFKYKKIIFFILSLMIQYSSPTSILIIYNTPYKKPNLNWKDGFIEAINILSNKYNFYWAIASDLENMDLSKFDIFLVKSGFNTECDKICSKKIPLNKPKALLISNTNTPKNEHELLKYNVLFFETYWYRQFIKEHPHSIHAFGINTKIMNKEYEKTSKIYDYIMVCDFKYKTKRHHLFLKKAGKKVAVGSIDKNKNKQIQTIFQNNGIEILESLQPEDLAKLYHKCKKAYLPCNVNGGGDRSVLEARSCGLAVEIESDNPKLKELLNSPIYDEYYYAKQIESGIEYMKNLNLNKSRF